jgi:hypothetical protein
VPDEPGESFAGKLRDQFGERLVCGLVGAGLVGGIWICWRGKDVWLEPSVGALIGFGIGAVLGERLLAAKRFPALS